MDDGSLEGNVFGSLDDSLNRRGLNNGLGGNLWHIVPDMLNGVVFGRQDFPWNSFHITALLVLGDGALPGHHLSVLTDLIVHDCPLIGNVLKA